MTAATGSSTSTHRAAQRRATVDVFGVAWPRHKAESVVAALVVLALGLLLTAAVGGTSASPAILAAAGAGIAVWWCGHLVQHD